MSMRCLMIAVILTPLLEVSFSLSANAATLESMTLVMDGSAKPPGDRLDYSIRFEAEETELELIVRGFLVSGARNETVSSIAAVQGDQPGDALVRIMIRPDTANPLKQGSLVIAYQSMHLSAGDYLVGYELSGRGKKGLEFVRATKLTRVTVTEQTRKTINVASTEVQSSLKKEKQRIRIAGERVRGAPPELKEIEVSIESPRLESLTRVEQVAVEIPGEYQRRELPPRSSQTSELPYRSAETDNLQDTPWQPLSELKPENERRVWFATNRAYSAAAAGKRSFADKIGEQLTCGRCIVNIPVDRHTKGNVESPSWWQLRDPKKHFTIRGIEVLKKSSFADQLDDRDVLLFVHGFSNTFEGAIFRTAQIHHDLGFVGRPLAFCWPSLGKLNEYEADQALADESVGALLELLVALCSRMDQQDGSAEEGAKIHIIAHSMGNRLLLQAMYRLARTESVHVGSRRFGQIILAAPDVGAIMFNNLVPYVVEAAGQTTYYYCSYDAALSVSREINRYEPVGLMAYFDDGICTINANGVGTSFLSSHDYYASTREVLADIGLMVNRGLAPEQRMPPLAAEIEVFGHQGWAFVKRVHQNRED